MAHDECALDKWTKHNAIPPVDGATYTSAHVRPGINIDVYGPDEGLAHIKVMFRATDDSNEQYWQGLPDSLAVQEAGNDGLEDVEVVPVVKNLDFDLGQVGVQMRLFSGISCNLIND